LPRFYAQIMKSVIRFFPIIILAIFAACTPGQHIAQLNDQALEAYEAGNYQEALSLYESLIHSRRAEGEFVGGANFNRAGLSAWAVGDTTRALEYLDAARHTEAANEQTLAALAKAYRGIDNLSREITNLETYLERYPEGDEADAFRTRLFETYVESNNREQAMELWPQLEPAARQQEHIVEGYFSVNKDLGNEARTDELAHELLAINENNVTALEWLARKHFWQAENRYQAEMKAYEQNRTHRQYARLLDALEIINTDFRIALNYFNRLYRMDPAPAHARYIGNIYLRFDDKERADYYHRRANQ
jgi:hypothetical protein